MQILIALVLLLGVGGTAVASDTATPGDALFAIDRAVEDIRIAFADEDKKKELRLRFAEERVAELEQIVDEEQSSFDDKDASGDDVVVLGLSRVYATVFTDQTVVEVTLDASSTIFTTDASSQAEIVEAVVAEYDVAVADVESVLVVEIEDREIAPEDLVVDIDDSVSAKSNQRVEKGLESALEYLAKIDQALLDSGTEYDLSDLIARINAEIESLSGEALDIDIKISDHGASFIKTKVTDDDGETKTEIKETGNGTVLVKTKSGDDEKVEITIKKDDGKKGSSYSSEGEDYDGDYKDKGLTEVEAKTVGDMTVVEVEYNDYKTSFTMEASDTESIIEAVVIRYNVLSEQVAKVIKLESDDDKHDSDDSSGKGDDNDKDEYGSDDDSSFEASDDNQLEIEVKVEDGMAEVEVKIDGVKNEFTLDLTDEDAIIAAVALQYPSLTVAEIKAVMDFEVKD